MYQGDERPLVRAEALEDAGRLLPDERRDAAVGHLDAALTFVRGGGRHAGRRAGPGSLRTRGVRRVTLPAPRPPVARAHRIRAGGRGPRRGGGNKPRGCRPPVHLPLYRELPPAAHLQQTGDQVTRRAGPNRRRAWTAGRSLQRRPPGPLWRGRYLIPESAVEVEVVAAGLAGRGVADVGVQRVPVVGELHGAAGPADGADPAGQVRGGRRGAGYRRPVKRRSCRNTSRWPPGQGRTGRA